MTHYDVLQIDRTATSKEIRAAYKTLARELHPDVNAEDRHATEKFVDLQLAYQTLADPMKRSDYDRTLGPRRTREKQTIQEVAYWKQEWEKDTLEQREKRRESYRHYASGDWEYPDIGGYIIRKKSMFKGFMETLGAIALTYFVGWKFFGELEIKSYDDHMSTDDFRTVKFVAAFLNPFTLQWNRLEEGQDAPTPIELYNFYAEKYGVIAVNKSTYPTNELTVVKMPKHETVAAVLFKKSEELYQLVKIEKKKNIYRIFSFDS